MFFAARCEEPESDARTAWVIARASMAQDRFTGKGNSKGAVLDVALRVELDPLFEGAQEVAR